MKYIACLIIYCFLFTACHKGPLCPAYNSVHSDKNYAYNPNNPNKSDKNNKADVEARKKTELSSKRKKRGRSSLFPKGMLKR